MRLGLPTGGPGSPEFGGLSPIPFPNAFSTVEEIRYEPFAIHITHDGKVQVYQSSLGFGDRTWGISYDDSTNQLVTSAVLGRDMVIKLFDDRPEVFSSGKAAVSSPYTPPTTMTPTGSSTTG